MNQIELWINVLLPILSIAIPVFATIYTVNNRIKNENRENHKPYLVLRKINDLDNLDIFSYYLIMLGRKYLENNNLLSDEEIVKIKNDSDINIELVLRNIGYGVATNIKFYNLLTGRQINGSQASNKEQNQKLFTTYDIASLEEKVMQAKIVSLVNEEDGIIKEDHNRILCIYKDLNNNVYSLIISINVKEGGHYDFFAYQPSSKSYKKWIKENQKQYKMIYKKYGEL